MKIIVTGGREYRDTVHVYAKLNELSPTLVIQGGAAGADSLAKAWAILKGVKYITCEADWKTHGRAAGPIRNRKMLEANQDAIVLAFPGGRGTENCIVTAISLGMKVIRG